MFELRRWAAAGVVTLLAGVLAPAGTGTAAARTPAEPAGRIEVTHLTLPDRDRVSDEMLMNERGEVVLHPIDTGDIFHWRNGEVTRINPEDTPATATAISAKGQVVGYDDRQVVSADRQPFSWVDGEWEILPLGEARRGQAIDVNDRGTVVGRVDGELVVWKDGDILRAPEELLGLFFVDETHINNRDQIAVSVLVDGDIRTVIWDVDTGEVTELGTLGEGVSVVRAFNDRGMATGVSFTIGESGERAFLWQDGEMTDLGTLGGDIARGVDLNKRGQVVGESFSADDKWRAFLWQDGEMTDLGTLGGDHSEALGINDRGQVVGNSYTPEGRRQAFLWNNGQTVNLGELTDPDASSRALDINNRGQVVGYTRGDDWINYHGVMWTAKRHHDRGNGR